VRTTGSLLLISFVLATGSSWLPALAQSERPRGRAGRPSQIVSDPQFAPRRNDDPKALEREREMAKRRNEDRHEALRKDTEKLLELATELKGSVDESDENQLSLEVIRKAEEIEKLARRVRNRMRGR
jgi:hypothetical protein